MFARPIVSFFSNAKIASTWTKSQRSRPTGSWLWRVGIILCLWCAFSTSQPAIAQPSPSRPTEQELQRGEAIASKALEATRKGDFATAETYWTQLIEAFPQNPAVWSNRGNARVSQNRLDEAIADYNQAIELAPNAPDPYLNRGTAYEGLGKFELAIADYNRILDRDPEDAMAYNNRGNAKAGLGRYQAALSDYQQAALIAPNFAFARANAALCLYQLGRTDEAIREMRNLVRKYSMFPDMRAALTAALWGEGQTGEAESNWVAALALDARYRNLDWVANIRRWPPRAVAALEKFLNLES